MTLDPAPPNSTSPVGVCASRPSRARSAARSSGKAWWNSGRRIMPLTRCTRRGSQPPASACAMACSVPHTRCCAVPGSAQKCGGWSAMSVSTVTKGTPGRACARLSCRARLKLGISDTTRSGRVACQCRASRCTRLAWPMRIKPCSSFSSCARPSVKPVASRLLYTSSGSMPVRRLNRPVGSTTSVRLTLRTCQGRPWACITCSSACAAARWPPPALNQTRSTFSMAPMLGCVRDGDVKAGFNGGAVAAAPAAGAAAVRPCGCGAPA